MCIITKSKCVNRLCIQLGTKNDGGEVADVIVVDEWYMCRRGRWLESVSPRGSSRSVAVRTHHVRRFRCCSIISMASAAQPPNDSDDHFLLPMAATQKRPCAGS